MPFKESKKHPLPKVKFLSSQVFCGVALQPFVPQSVWTCRVALSQLQNMALVLGTLGVVNDCPTLKFHMEAPKHCHSIYGTSNSFNSLTSSQLVF